ncbi:hypothetical protein D917_02018 [Trichinella nativa]|uniref:THAP4-like heme-binding domain-containing protein n=1 Tax=Trichinella nativa TaxID=6335 RepID=A0A1Y3EMM6_9BILA|nr:hypothetical protein D917_02018 [Trichinella nativa]
MDIVLLTKRVVAMQDGLAPNAKDHVKMYTRLVLIGKKKEDAFGQGIPPGLPLPPYLELLKQLIGEWDLNSDDSINYPVNFAKGGYNKVLRIMLTQVPLFDTPSLNYTGFARSKEDSNDIQEEKGFIWVRPAKSPTREVAYMITTNSGISMLQEGHLKNNYIQLHTVHDANHPYSRCEQPYLRNEHTFSWNDHQLTETFKDDSGRVHFKTYVKRVT